MMCLIAQYCIGSISILILYQCELVSLWIRQSCNFHKCPLGWMNGEHIYLRHTHLIGPDERFYCEMWVQFGIPFGFMYLKQLLAHLLSTKLSFRFTSKLLVCFLSILYANVRHQLRGWDKCHMIINSIKPPSMQILCLIRPSLISRHFSMFITFTSFYGIRP